MTEDGGASSYPLPAGVMVTEHLWLRVNPLLPTKYPTVVVCVSPKMAPECPESDAAPSSLDKRRIYMRLVWARLL